MAAITILKNTEGLITPEIDFIDTGWSISAGLATHFPCNPGTMRNTSVQGLIVSHTYNVTYDVLNYGSGEVYFVLGGESGATLTGNVTAHSEDIICADDTGIAFFSNGLLSVQNLVIYDLAATAQPVTFSFNEQHKQWTENQSFVPDMMLKHGSEFYSFKDGTAWVHNKNPVKNNFYGVQYPSQITFLMNSDPRTVKIMQGMIFNANKLWWVPNITIKPYTGKSLGMQSRIKPGRFKVLQGVFYADFLRNLLDPRFGTQIEALLQGEELRGRIAAITIQNDDNVDVELFEVQVKYAPQMLTP